MDMEYLKKQLSRLTAVALATSLLIAGCEKDEEETVADPPAVTSGMVVACEGTFGASNASIHKIYDDGNVGNAMYAAANGVAPGDVLQQYREFEGRGYAVLNNSQKVDVLNTSDFSLIGTITGCDYPRDVFVLSQSKGYISNGSGAGELLIFDPLSLDVTGSITVGQGPEEIAYNGTYVFVANSGGFGIDNTVSVIDPLSDAVIATVETGDVPISLEVDYQNNVWVLCKGAIEYDADWNIVNETEAFLQRIDGMSHVITGQLQIGELGDHPQFMDADGDRNRLYLVNDGSIRPFNIVNGEFDGTFNGGPFHSVGVNPVTDEVYASSVPNYVDNDEVNVLTSEGVFVASYNVGIAPRAYVHHSE